MLLLLGLVPWAMRAQAQGAAFSCDGSFYQVRQVGSTSQIFKVNRSNASTYTTDPLNIVGGSNDLGVLVNGLAYNSQDGYMYALSTPGSSNTIPTTVSLYKIGQSGIALVGPVMVAGGANLALIVATGTFDKAGHYYFSSQNTGTANYNLYTLDLNSATPLVAASKALSSNTTFYDFSYNPLDGFLYGANWVNSLYKIDQNGATTATVTSIPTAPTISQNASQAVGTMAFDVAGNLFAYNNGTVGTANSANFYQVNTSTGLYTSISAISPASVSDGASCINPGNSLDVTKELTNVKAVNSFTYDISYAIRVRNTYTSTNPGVQVSDVLTGSTANSTFPTATSVVIVTAPAVTNLDGSTLAANAAYTGLSAIPTGSSISGAALLDGTQLLTAGQRAVITYTVRVNFGSAGNVPGTVQNNTAYASSSSSTPNRGYTLAANGTLLSPNDLVASDASTDGTTFPVLRAGDPTYGTPTAVDAPTPTPVQFIPSISGTVFEDVNYGGGLGNSRGSSQGVGLVGARVELYTVAAVTGIATYSTFTTTGSTGGYTFAGLTAGSSYVVRVVNSTVASSRSGAVAGLLPVQTYRTTVTAADGTLPDPSRVGGEDPSRGDAGPGTTNTPLAALSTLTVGTTIGTIAESQTPVALSASNAPAVNVDFGYNFDLVVNKNAAGQGSLAQFITNSNALGEETTLAQAYTATSGTTTPLAAKQENSIFMLPNGAAVAGQVAGLTSQFTGSTATIALTAALPPVTGPLTVIDGGTQASSTGSNPAVTTTGAETTGPEIILNLNGQTGLAFSGANEQLLNLGITGSAATSSGVLVNSAATNLTISSNTIYSNGVNITLLGSASGTTVANNVIRGSTRANGGGIVAQSGTSGGTFTQNIFGGNNGLAIDLTNGTSTSGDGVTLNDNGDVDTGANGLLNFPVITLATISNGNLIVRGYARPGSKIELYNAAADPTGFGEGQAYLGTVTEGSPTGGTNANLVPDTNPATGQSYAGIVYGVNQGADNSASAFTFTIPVGTGAGQINVSLATILTTTATLAGNTSEFSGNVRLSAPVANDVTNVALLATSPATVLSPNLSATPIGAGTTIFSYRVADLSNLNGTLTYNGTTVASTTVITDLTRLAYQPTLGFVGPASFPYYALDNNGGVSNTATYTIPVTAVAEVMAAFPAATPTAVTAGQPLALTVNFTNNGPNDAAGVTRSVQLPAGLTANGTVTASGGGTYNTTTGLVTYPSTATLTPTANLNSTITISAVPTSLAALTAVALITTTSNEGGATANNVATTTVAVTPSIDLATTLDGPTTLVAGTLATYTVTTTNNGPSPAGRPAEGATAATGAGQTVRLPAGLSGVFATNGGTYSSTTGIVTFPDVALASGQVVTNSISFSVDAAITAFAVQALVAPTSATVGLDPVAGNNSAYLNGSATAVSTTTSAPTGTTPATTANLYVTTTGPAQVAPDAPATYTVTQGNYGPLAAGGVQTQVSLPTGLSTLTLSINGTAYPGTLSAAAKTITFGSGATAATYSQVSGLLVLPALAADQAVAATPQSYSIGLTAPTTGPAYTVTASVKATTSDLMPANNVASVVTDITPPPTDVTIALNNLTVNASGAASSSIVAGQLVSYEVQTSNPTPVPARNVQQLVTLPTSLDATTLRVGGLTGTLNAGTGVVTYASGATYTVGTGTLKLPLLPGLVGGAVQATAISFAAPAVNTSSVFVLPASATVSTSSPESNLSNNAATASVSITSAQDVTVSLAGPAQVVVGNPVLYTVATTNNGPSANGTQTTTVTLPPALAPASLLINNAASTSNTGSVYTFGTGATAITYTVSTGVVAFPATSVSLPKTGLSSVNTIQFAAPNVTLLNAVANVTTSGTDLNPTNNSAQVITPLSTSSLAATDLRTSITSTAAATTLAGSLVTIGITTQNLTATAATGVTQTLVLAAGLTNNGGTVTTTNSGVYDNLTGVVTFTNVGTLAANATTPANTATFSLPPSPTGSPANYVLTATASSATANPESNLTNNTATATMTVTPKYDLTTSISGPTATSANAPVSYAVTLTNAGPSATNTFSGTFTLPAGVTSYTVNGGTPQTAASGATVTIRAATGATFLPGSTELYQVAFTAPGSTFLVQAGIASTSAVAETNVAPNAASLVTSINQAPLAYDVVNKAQSPEGNTADALALDALSGADLDGGSIAGYTITSLPNATTQGVLSLNGTALVVGSPVTFANAGNLRFDPVSTFVGNTTFTYTATDNGNGNATYALTSAPARYTIAVGKDANSFYTATPNKGRTNQYVTDDVLAYAIDPNGAAYTSSALVYSAAGRTTNILVGTSGIGSTALLASGSGPGAASGNYPANPTNALPAGVSLDPATGMIFVSDATQLVNYSTVRYYQVNVRTVDVNGGINTVAAQFSIGAYPLPVVLASFTAQAVANRDALLSWAIASEKSNDHFEVERSFDGATFTQLAKVAGHGTTSAAAAYAFTDAGIGRQAPGPVYYRLRQVDVDGTATYSAVRSVSFAPAATVSLSLYPNPAADRTSLDLGPLAAASVQVQVLDATGRTVLTATLAGGSVQPLDVHALAAGTYNVLVTGARADGSALRQVLRLTKD